MDRNHLEPFVSLIVCSGGLSEMYVVGKERVLNKIVWKMNNFLKPDQCRD